MGMSRLVLLVSTDLTLPCPVLQLLLENGALPEQELKVQQAMLYWLHAC
jgi:hypothetical protein